MALPDPAGDVVTRVSTLAAASSRPVLTQDEVKATILAYAMPDADGITPDVTGWTPTWDINRAVSELWGIKAGKVAGDFNFGADGSNFSKGEVMAQCLEMQAKFAAKVVGSASTASPGDERWMTERLMVNSTRPWD